MNIISAQEAAALIQDNWCVIPGGFGSCGHPDALTKAIRARFQKTGSPKNLSLLFGAGQGDKKGNGIDTMALKGLVGKAIGGFLGLVPELVKLAMDGEIELHNWPQGVVSQLFTEIARCSPGLVTHVGMDTFVDPIHGGGVVDNRGTTTPLVERIDFRGEQKLFYPSQKVDVALLRGTMADERGNICSVEETSYMDSLAQALATKNSGGIVIVQVKRTVKNGEIAPQLVKIPGFLVDYVVIADEADHPQTYGKPYDPAYTSATAQGRPKPHDSFPLEKRLIAYRAALELAKHPHATINLGIGIPALIGAQADLLGMQDYTLTVESGLVGGIPDEGLSFGAAMNPQGIMEQSALFDLYSGHGVDVAFLGFAQVDGTGSVNVSKFGRRAPGSGGFINIVQGSKKIVFCGTFGADGLRIKNENGTLVIEQECKVFKFCPQVEHLTFNGPAASRNGVVAMYITERAVFSLENGRLTLIEIAPGITVESLRAKVDCPFVVSDNLIPMPGFDVIF